MSDGADTTAWKDADLIHYDQAIEFYYSPDNSCGWFVFRNYACVFETSGSVSKAKKIVVGTPLTPNQHGLFDQDIRLMELGLLMDPIHIIRFQREVLAYHDKIAELNSEWSLRRAIFAMGYGLIAIGLSVSELDELADPKTFLRSGRELLRQKLEKHGITRFDPKHYAEITNEGFHGYLPFAAFIRQEERTRFKPNNWKTENDDRRRDITVVESALDPYCSEVFDETGEKKYSDAISQYIDQFDRELEQKEGRLGHHATLGRVTCFGFRGDRRTPKQINDAQGMLPGVTRTDPFQDTNATYIVSKDKLPMKIKEAAAVIDNVLGIMPKLGSDAFKQRYGDITQQRIDELSAELKAEYQTWYANARQQAKKKKGKVGRLIDRMRGRRLQVTELSDYYQALRFLNLFHLGSYTLGEAFRCFVSTTKSIAIAKHFSNAWSTSAVSRVWCYALRCRGAYELPSSRGLFHVVGENGPEEITVQNKYDLQKIHQFSSYFEQELAQPGPIWKEHVVGCRQIYCNEDGQFFSGPVFISHLLIQQEADKVVPIVRIMSGESQGDDPTIMRSYKPLDPGAAETWVFEPNVADRTLDRDTSADSAGAAS